jgi:hypothetical protein
MKYLLFTIFLLAFLSAPASHPMMAQNTLKVHFSYEAANFAPSDYRIRALPPLTAGSSVKISGMIFYQNPNGELSISDPASYNYQWYHNNRFIAGGKGVSSIMITVSRRALKEEKVLLRLFDNKGKFLADFELRLPRSSPIVTIRNEVDGSIALREAPIFAKPNSTLTLIAVPYFFTQIENLEFVWRQQGERITQPFEDQKKLNIIIPSNPIRQKPILYSVSAVTRGISPPETAEKIFSITIP